MKKVIYVDADPATDLDKFRDDLCQTITKLADKERREGKLVLRYECTEDYILVPVYMFDKARHLLRRNYQIDLNQGVMNIKRNT